MTQAREWTLDGVGNWSQTRTKVGGSIGTESRSDTSFNEYSSIGGTAQSHDPNGNLTDDGTHLYEWDGLNRLVSVSDKASEATIVTYAYDTGNRRMLLDEATASTSDTVYCYSGWQVLEEAPQSAPGAPDRQFVYGNYIDEALVMNTDGNADGDCLDAGTDPAHYYHQNTLYSVYALTDASGVVVEAYSYDPYGNHTLHLDGPDAGSAVDFSSDDLQFAEGRSPHLNPYGFTGRRFDRETGLWHYRNRPYRAGRGRFVSRDPSGYGNGVCLYQYAGGIPVRAIDPSGLTALIREFSGQYLSAPDSPQGTISPEPVPDSVRRIFRAVFRRINIAKAIVTTQWSPRRFDHVGNHEGNENDIEGARFIRERNRWEGECHGLALALADEQYGKYRKTLDQAEPELLRILVIHKWAGLTEHITIGDHWSVVIVPPYRVTLKAKCVGDGRWRLVKRSERGRFSTSNVSAAWANYPVLDPTHGITTRVMPWLRSTSNTGWRISNGSIDTD